MTNDRKDKSGIIAMSDDDAPEILDTDALDAMTGGAEYGGTNTCEPRHPVDFTLNFGKIEDATDEAIDSFEITRSTSKG